jgi:threonine/homoserine/homoserine lactone efflux protein
MLCLGCIFVLMAAVSDGVYALLAGTIGKWLRASRRPAMLAQRFGVGGVYIVLGMTAALADLRGE